MGCFRFNDNKSVKKKYSSLNRKNDSLKSASSSASDSLTNSLDDKESLIESDAARKVVAVDAANDNASLDLNPKEVLLSGNTKPKGKEARAFKFNELVAATGNFRQDCFLGEGGFGKVYKGKLPSTGEVVAVKQLDRNGTQGMREFIIEVLTLSLAEHPNLVKLIGYCGEGDQKLLVYEYMPLGSLENHLHESRCSKRRGLDWITRMKIAAGAAKGLEYLHEKMKPPVIYRDLKCSNILLGKDYHSKLSDFGLAKVGPSGDNTHVSTRVMGTYGYCAPDYAMTGQLTFKSDIYSFGVVLLELITGRTAIDPKKKEQNLVHWARPMFKDRKRFAEMVDPMLEGRFPMRGLFQAIAIAAMCVQEKPNMRPNISDVVTALNFIASQDYPPKPRIQNGEQEHEQEQKQEQEQIQEQDGKVKSCVEEGTSGSNNKSTNLHEMPFDTKKIHCR